MRIFNHSACENAGLFFTNRNERPVGRSCRLKMPALSLVILAYLLITPDRRGRRNGNHRTLLQLNVIAALNYDRACTGASAYYCSDRRALAAADYRADYGTRSGSDTAAFDGFLRLAVTFCGSFGVDLYVFALSVFDTVERSGKIVSFTVA